MKLQHVREISQLEFDTYEKKLHLQQELGILGSSTETDDSSNGLMSSTDKTKLNGMTLMTTTEFEALFK